MKKAIERRIKIIEGLTGYRVLLREVDEGVKNNVITLLQRINQDLNTLNDDVTIAMSSLNELPNSGSSITKLQGLQSIINSSLTDNTEMIANITGMQTNQSVMNSNQAPRQAPGEQSVEEAIEMTPDEAINNIDDVSKLEDKNMDVVLTDKPGSNKNGQTGSNF